MKKIQPYVAGEQPQDKSYIKLNTNENPWPPSPKVIEKITAAANAQLQRYPDPDSTALRKKIADYYALDMHNVFIGNGSDEVLAHAFKAFFQQDIPICFPDISYGFYPVFCEYFCIEYEKIAVTNTLEIALDDYPVNNGGIIFPNPNAPTGHYLEKNQIAQLLQRNTESVVIIDEAYIDFAPESAISLCQQYNNILITQTLSKSRSLAGIRAGFAVGHVDLITALHRVKNSFNAYPVDSVASAAAIAAFDDDDYFRDCCKKIINTREWTNAELNKLAFRVNPSQANFLLVTHPAIAAESYYLALKAQGILVRHFNNGRVTNYVRITIGTETEMQALVAASKKIIAGC